MMSVGTPFARGGGAPTGRRSLAVLVLAGLAFLLAPVFAPAPSANPEDLMSLDVQKAEIATVLRTIADFSDRNIVAGPEVTGQVTVRLLSVSWQSALDVVLRANSYGWKEDMDGIIRVTTIKNLQNEDVEKEAAERKREDLLPLKTRVLPVNFAKADELNDAVQTILSQRGEVHVDTRTNSLLVKDIEQNIERAAELVSELDQETKQVEIVARLVDLDARVSRELGIEWLASNLNNPSIDATGEAAVDAAVPGPAGQFSIGTIGPGGTLDATLSALATENKARIISNPRITTLDNQEAWILVGKKIPLIVSDPSGNPITELTTIGIQMTVTPHIHANDNITLDLHPEVSDLSSQATVQGGIIIVTSEASTRVMVESGQTAVIGGLIRSNSSESGLGVPFLRDIPLLGRFFSSSSDVDEQRELLIFVTPRIMDVKDLRSTEEVSEALQP
ncbi:MAG: type IV pilus secretin PilQ [Candidatus Latescibacterota bacterium]|nr:MAG: type IV pilus secretin PilQ [Candidatus Latescibacterota bacterium]